MRVVLLHNPSSGRGKGTDAVAQAERELVEAGFTVHPVAAGRGTDPAVLPTALRSADALIIAGGDGSVHHAAPAAIDAGVPIYHFPRGTENLFAREFGMTRSPSCLVAALRAGRTRHVDVGHCDGRMFLLMASLGFDACVVERVAEARTHGVTRIDYLRHALGEFRSMRIPRVSVTVDGRELVTDRPGLVIVANSPQYAAKLNPASNATIDDGLLDVIILPITSRASLLRWVVSIATRSHLRRSGALSARGRAVTVWSDPPDHPLQLDGECISPRPKGGELNLSITPGALRILMPA